MAYSSYVASSGTQVSYGVDVDAKGTIYLAGFSNGAIFDALQGTPKTTAAGNTDAFLMGVNPQ